MAKLSELVGVTISSITVGDDFVEISTSEGLCYRGYHLAECCESIDIERVDGDPATLVGQVVTETVEESIPGEPPDPDYDDSWTRTHWTIRTAAGLIAIHWLGQSNGYYGETPYFELSHPPTGSPQHDAYLARQRRMNEIR